ncbi:hypothetical protein DMA11_14195 [Marinilabiliaceae bacterium JC017]|nr:hypothetical protein DMA11_14195 [Marinilabiliaceae bacterium JC017]
MIDVCFSGKASLCGVISATGYKKYSCVERNYISSISIVKKVGFAISQNSKVIFAFNCYKIKKS